MVPHIGSEESAGLAGSGGDWGVCVDAPVVVGRCAVGPPPLRRFFRAEGVAKKCLRSAHGWGVWGGKSNGAPDRNPGKGELGDVHTCASISCFNGAPDRNPGKGYQQRGTWRR